ncbi:hypothetical protein AAZX31_20G056800 [Glycine max]
MSHATALNFDLKPVARAVAFPLSSTAEFPPLKLVLKPVTKACVSLLSSKVEFLPLKPFGLWSLHSHFCFAQPTVQEEIEQQSNGLRLWNDFIKLLGMLLAM